MRPGVEKEEKVMVSWVWIPVSYFVGFLVACFLCACEGIGKD